MASPDNTLAHPTEEMFERLLVRKAEGTELEAVEYHILACDICLVRMQNLDHQITATNLALRTITRKQAARAAAKGRVMELNRLKRPILSLAVVSAIFYAGLSFHRQRFQENVSNAKVSLSAYRDSKHAVLSQTPVQVTLDAADLPEGRVLVQIVDSSGSEVWRGDSTVFREQAEISLPRISRSGSYLLRLYAPASRARTSQILREFVFDVK
jgi:hypothetical protein